jgi:hypothetical protein
MLHQLCHCMAWSNCTSRNATCVDGCSLAATFRQTGGSSLAADLGAIAAEREQLVVTWHHQTSTSWLEQLHENRQLVQVTQASHVYLIIEAFVVR